MLDTLRASADLFLGLGCAACGEPGYIVCPGCRARIIIDPCVAPGFSVPVMCASIYAEPLSSLLVAHKERGAWHLAGYLASLLAQAVDGLGAPTSVLVPVPSRPKAIRERGYDHAWQLARRAAARRADRRLVRVAGGDQVGKGRAERLANIHHTMRARKVTREPVVIVDDIVTTGASMTEAIAVCQAAGMTVVGAAAICRTPTRNCSL